MRVRKPMPTDEPKQEDPEPRIAYTIEQALEAIESAKEARSRAEQAIAEADALEGQIDEIFPRIRDGDLKRVANLIWHLYWDEDWIKAKTVQTIAESHFGDDYNTWKTLIKAEVSIECDECGTEITVTVGSRTRYKELKEHKSYPRLRCEACQAQHNRMQHEAEAGRKKKVLAFVMSQGARLEELKNMPYTEYLQTDEWAHTRQAALKRAHYRCQLCNSKQNLHVHHRTYERLGKEAAHDLVVLCEICHQKHHEIGGQCA